MERRLKLHEILCEILGSRNVYYQPPKNISMKYPCVRYSLSNEHTRYANNKKYIGINRYELIYIDRKPDSVVVTDLLSLPYCSLSRTYVSDNLHHYVMTLYY